jgi:DNA topoisomerase I
MFAPLRIMAKSKPGGRRLQARKISPKHSAKAASLRYVSEQNAGISRVKNGRGFRYLTAQGRPLRDRATLARIRGLVIPPAWTDVWICPSPSGHLQAVGRDARGRKQYRYHPRWNEVRDDTKYGRLAQFAAALPRIRSRVRADLRRNGLSKEKALATIVQLLESTLIRVGNEEYARSNGSYGLTTFKNRHAKVRGAQIQFRFKGKGGIAHCVEVSDLRLARLVKKFQDLPGQDLFQYVDEHGQTRDITSSDLNEYLRGISGEDFSAKDFRTWAGTLLAAQMLCNGGVDEESESGRKKQIVATIKTVAAQLGNTVAVCRKCYVHPAVLDAYLAGKLPGSLAKRGSRKAARERALIRFLSKTTAGSAAKRKVA